MDYTNKLLLVEIENHVALVTLNNPPLNILTLELSAEMRDTLHKLEEDEDVRVIVLGGSGEKAFCQRSAAGILPVSARLALSPGLNRALRMFFEHIR